MVQGRTSKNNNREQIAKQGKGLELDVTIRVGNGSFRYGWSSFLPLQADIRLAEIDFL
jgi:hypothetical protein